MPYFLYVYSISTATSSYTREKRNIIMMAIKTRKQGRTVE
jgi:hypothetical protein